MVVNAFFILVLLWCSLIQQTAAQSGGTSSLSVVPGRVWARFVAHTAPAGLNKAVLDGIGRFSITGVEPAFANLLKGQPQTESIAECGSVFAVSYNGGHNPHDVAAVLAQDSSVIYAEPMPVRYVTAQSLPVEPNDPLYGQQSEYLGRLELPAAWEIVKGNQGDVVIAVVDTGVDWPHVDLRANAWSNLGEIPDNDRDDDSNGYVDDVHGYDFGVNRPYAPGTGFSVRHMVHGTQIAGLAAAVADNAIGITGSGWNARLMSVGVSCEGSASRICHAVTGVLYAASHGADIINISLGGYEYSATEAACVEAATDMGALVVAAAGNEGLNIDVQPYYPASYARVLAVGVTGRSGDAHLFNYGSSVDVFAPGGPIITTIPGDGYDHSASGSSYAAPLVAGIAALVRTAFPTYSADQVRERIRRTADSIDYANPPEFTGLLGYGRPNAFRAVTGEWSFASQLVMHGSYPNPFNFVANVVFDLPVESRVSVEVVNVLGRRVWQGPSVEMDAGFGQVYTVDGRGLASGAYFYRLRAESFTNVWVGDGTMLRVRQRSM